MSTNAKQNNPGWEVSRPFRLFKVWVECRVPVRQMQVPLGTFLPVAYLTGFAFIAGRGKIAYCNNLSMCVWQFGGKSRNYTANVVVFSSQ